jgi:hypothetical protein
LHRQPSVFLIDLSTALDGPQNGRAFTREWHQPGRFSRIQRNSFGYEIAGTVSPLWSWPTFVMAGKSEQIRDVCVRRRHDLSSCGASDGTLFKRRNVAIERTQHPRTERRFVSICRSIAASPRSHESRSAGPAEDGDPLFLRLPRVNSTENIELAPRDLVSGSPTSES